MIMYHFTLCLNRISLVHLDSGLGSFVDYGVPGTGRQLQIELATLTVIQSHIQRHIFPARWNKEICFEVLLQMDLKWQGGRWGYT